MDKLKIGAVVKVYQKPFMQEGFEGFATLMKYWNRTKGILFTDAVAEHWQVLFLSGNVVNRWVCEQDLVAR